MSTTFGQPYILPGLIAVTFLGINVIADEIQRDPSKVKLIKDRGQVLFCWTDDQNNPAIVQVWTLTIFLCLNFIGPYQTSLLNMASHCGSDRI